MRQIVLYPNGKLRQKSVEVTTVNRELLAAIAETTAVLQGRGNGAGLAAPQVGILKRFFVTKEWQSREPVVVINPRLVEVDGKKEFPMIKSDKGEWENFYEGCLSFPNIWGTAKRYLKVEAVWNEIKGKKLIKVQKTLVGFEAIVFQHEMDHLDGVLFVDRIKESGGQLYWQKEEKMEEISWEFFEDNFGHRD